MVTCEYWRREWGTVKNERLVYNSLPKQKNRFSSSILIQQPVYFNLTLVYSTFLLPQRGSKKNSRKFSTKENFFSVRSVQKFVSPIQIDRTRTTIVVCANSKLCFSVFIYYLVIVLINLSMKIRAGGKKTIEYHKVKVYSNKLSSIQCRKFYKNWKQ